MNNTQKSEIIFSDHAIYQIQERNISQKSVIKTINFPDKIILQNDQLIRVVKLFIRIITSKIKKYL